LRQDADHLNRTKSTRAGFDPYVNNALDAQQEKTTLGETDETGHPVIITSRFNATTASIVPKDDDEKSPFKVDEATIKAEEERQWQWAVAEEILPVSKDERASQILEEVGRMEVFLDSVADRVQVVKEKLDAMEQEGGIVLHLKDNSS